MMLRKLSTGSDKETADCYGRLWRGHRGLAREEKYHFQAMQEAFPEKIVRGSIGLEVGCGSGWDAFTMASVNPGTSIISLDLSDGVYTAKEVNKDMRNVLVIKASAEALPLKSGVCDFVYSFGVLHHLADPMKGFSEISRVLKIGAPCFVYLYEDHRRNPLKYCGIKLTSCLRRITTRLPPQVTAFFSCLLSPIIVILFSYPARVFKRFKPTYWIYELIPFNFGTGLFSLRGDLYDRFAAPIEHRFNDGQVRDAFLDNGFSNIRITRLKATAGYAARGTKR